MTGRTRPAEPPPDASRMRVAVVAAAFHDRIALSLVEGARSLLLAAGLPESSLEVRWVPGAFELPLACRGLAETGRFDAVVALGCVIRGETPHFDFVAGEAARGIMRSMLDTGVPIAFGVLTTEDRAQAWERAGGCLGNKGADSARAAVEMAALLSDVRGK